MSTADEMTEFYVHTVSTKTLIGTGAYGDVHAEPVDTAGFVDEKRRLVRDTTGQQVISETTIYGPPERKLVWTPGSLITLPSGREATVITCGVSDSGDLDLPDHVVAALT